MTRAVILTESEWLTLPDRLAAALAANAADPSGFAVIDRTTGEVSQDRLAEWLAPTLALAFWDVLQRMKNETT